MLILSIITITIMINSFNVLIVDKLTKYHKHDYISVKVFFIIISLGLLSYLFLGQIRLYREQKYLKNSIIHFGYCNVNGVFDDKIKMLNRIYKINDLKKKI